MKQASKSNLSNPIQVTCALRSDRRKIYKYLQAVCTKTALERRKRKKIIKAFAKLFALYVNARSIITVSLKM